MRKLGIVLVLVLGCSRKSSPPLLCPTWTLPENDTCLSRPWVLPSPLDAIGEPGARLRTLAIDGTGLGLATWDVALPDKSAVEVGEELGPGIWTVRDPAARLTGMDSASAAAAGPHGEALVTWVHAGGASGVYASERDAWGAWRDPGEGEARSFPPGAVEPWAAAAPSGEQFLVWCQETRGGWGISVARRTRPDVTWERPLDREDVVSPPILFANQPQIAVDARGDALVAWYQSEGVPLMTYVSERHGSGGAFSHPDRLDHLSAPGAPVASDPVANPRPALGPRGEAAVVWTQENGKGGLAVYLATRDAGAAWVRPRDLADSFSTAEGAPRSARVAFGAGDELYVIWVQADGAGVSAVFGARREADGRWSTPGRTPVRLSSPDKSAFGPTLAVGPEGGAIAAWVEASGPRSERVVARRTGRDRGWEPAEPLSDARTRPAGEPMAAMGPGDRTLVGWPVTDAGIVFAQVD